MSKKVFWQAGEGLLAPHSVIPIGRRLAHGLVKSALGQQMTKIVPKQIPKCNIAGVFERVRQTYFRFTDRPISQIYPQAVIRVHLPRSLGFAFPSGVEGSPPRFTAAMFLMLWVGGREWA